MLTYPRTAPLHGGSSAGKSDLCCSHSLDVVGRPGLLQSGLMSLCFAGCLSPGPRKNDLTMYWALEHFVRSFTLLVDPEISIPHILNIDYLDISAARITASLECSIGKKYRNRIGIHTQNRGM
jgi:hypothetical protein